MAMDTQAGGGPKNGRGKKGRAHPEMNVTPLVDVVLVLLIIFMVVMPMLSENFWIHIPKKPTETEPPPTAQTDDPPPIVITVNAKGQIQINQDVLADPSFAPRLQRMLVAQGERKVYFDASDNVPFQRAMQVMDMARGGGAAHIAVMTDPLQ